MTRSIVHALALALLTTLAGSALAQETPQSLTSAYDQLADAILAVKHTETGLVHAILDTHARQARVEYAAKNYEGAAAEMALFANEGDNRVAGVRKRLLEGGHHHNAEGESQGLFEPGFVVVTKDAKMQALAASSDMRRAKTARDAQAAWERFEALTVGLLGAR